jgi:hypothetical protein
MSVASDIGATKAYDELIDLVVGAFNARELEMLAKRKMGLTLYDLIEKGTLEQEVFDLFEAIQRRGSTTHFLRCIAAARPDPALRQAISRYHPQALEAPPAAAVQAMTIAAGVTALRNEANESPAVRRVIAASRDKLDQLNRKIDELFHYKELHDCLHTIQLRYYPTLIDRIKHFRADPLAAMEIRNKILELKDISASAREAVGKLPSHKAEKEMAWVEKLDAAIDELSKAVDTIEEHTAAHAVRQIRRRIHDEPARINGHLTDAAEELPLDELAQTIKTVISTFAKGNGSTGELQTAIHSLQEIQPRLRGRVAEHREWQDVEKDFWYAEECIELGSIENFKVVWPDIEAQVESLARTEPEAGWAKAFRDGSALINKNLAGQMDLAASQFKQLRNLALYHFVQLDRELLSQCRAILAIRDPLQSLLRE